MRYTGPKAKQCRREGVDLFGGIGSKYSKILSKRKIMPGGGSGGRGSEFSKQLREKQKLKRIAGINEKTMRKYVDKASKSKSATGDRLMQLLALRLDSVVHVCGFSSTRFQSRQFVSHKKIKVNDRVLNIPSYEVRIGDKISVVEGFSSNVSFNDLKSRVKNVPNWLSVDIDKKEISIIRLPENDELESLVEVHMIVEFYSR